MRCLERRTRKDELGRGMFGWREKVRRKLMHWGTRGSFGWSFFLSKCCTLLTLTQAWIHLHALECLLMLPSVLLFYFPLMSLLYFTLLRLKM